MAAMGVFDVTTRTAFASARNRSSGGRSVGEHAPTKRTALASVRYNISGGRSVVQLMPTRRPAIAPARNKSAGRVVADLAKQTRRAYVKVCNNTSDPILGVSVVHKYSSLFKHQHQWGLILPGETPEDYMEVEYNTGFLTTGFDWWVVTWYSSDMRTLYFSDPNNFRGLIDTLEDFAPDAIAAAAGATAALASSLTGPAAVAAAVSAAVAAKATTSALFSSETTAGFKEHMLREEDEGQVTVITINPDLTITFNSPSGVSNTVSSSKLAPGQ